LTPNSNQSNCFTVPKCFIRARNWQNHQLSEGKKVTRKIAFQDNNSLKQLLCTINVSIKSYPFKLRKLQQIKGNASLQLDGVQGVVLK
jgi:hypothetical protein